MDNEVAVDEKTRKSLAAYYTMHTSAALLAGLTLPNTLPKTGRANLYDYACGAGMLLIAGAERLHNMGYRGVVHLYGADVDRAALDKCKSNIAELMGRIPMSVVPHIYYAPLGPQPDGSVKIGSLEAMRRDWTWDDFELVYGAPADARTVNVDGA